MGLRRLLVSFVNRETRFHKVQIKIASPKTRYFYLAEWTGLEPATPGVTGRYSNQLNYHSIKLAYKCYFTKLIRFLILRY